MTKETLERAIELKAIIADLELGPYSIKFYKEQRDKIEKIVYDEIECECMNTGVVFNSEKSYILCRMQERIDGMEMYLAKAKKELEDL